MNARVLRGYAAGIAASATYGMNPLFALPLYALGMGTGPVLLWRYMLAIPIVGAMMLLRGQPFAMPMRRLAGVLSAGMLMAFSSLSLFESYNCMAASIASTLLFVYPLMVAVIMVAFFHERLTARTCVCLTLALAGIGLLYKGEGGETLSAEGMAWVMGSSLSYAIYIVMINRSWLREVPTLTLTFYSLVGGAAVFALLCGAGGMQVPSGAEMWICVVCLALLPTALSFVCTTVSVHMIGSTPTAILGVCEPLTAVLIGVFVFGEQLTSRDVYGLCMIMVAVTVVVSGSSLGRLGRSMVAVRKLFPRIRRGREGQRFGADENQ